jgi:hypothetical protein
MQAAAGPLLVQLQLQQQLPAGQITHHLQRLGLLQDCRLGRHLQQRQLLAALRQLLQLVLAPQHLVSRCGRR